MTNFDKKLEMAYKCCKPLKVECIKKELEMYLEGYTFKSIERQNGEWTVYFEGANEDNVMLSISFNNLRIMIDNDRKTERIAIDKNMLLTDRIIDKRQHGIVYSIIQKQFGSSNRFKQIVLTDLVEQRFTLTRDRINSLLKNADFDNIRLSNLLLKLRMLENKVDLKTQSDFYSEFSTHMNYYFEFDGVRKIKDNIYPSRTFLNGEDVSDIFVVDGSDKLYRIYDLYSGIINHRNENDINSINLGLLSQDVFNLKELKDISNKEDSLIGRSLANVDYAYINYLREFLNRKFGFKGNIKLDRDSMLLAITYQMSGPEIIITKEQIDRQIDQQVSSNSKKFSKRLLKPFNKDKMI